MEDPSSSQRAPWLIDITMSGGLTLLALLGAGADRSGWGPAAALLVTVPLLGRRYGPLVCFAVQLLGVGLFGPPSSTPPAIMLALAAGGYFATEVTGRRPRIMAAAGAVVGVTLLHFFGGHGSSLPLLITAWLTVFAVRSLWQRSQTAELYAHALRQEQQARQTLAVQTERARIARELHDVLGHNVSVMMIQAGAARQAVHDPPVAEALREVEAAGRGAMRELRQLLALLRPDGDDEQDLSPQPGLTQLDPLLDRVRAAGLPVTLTTHGVARALDPSVDLAAYRVIQEGLTNALKYAQGTPTDVTVEYEPAGLAVSIRDHGPSTAGRDGSGRGLLGLRERVALYHGSFEAGRCDDGGYRIRAYFPNEAS